MVDIIEIIAIVIPLVIIIYAVISSLRIVRPTEKGLVERLGKYHRFVQGGITFLVPFVDRIIKVNVTERMTPVQRQDVITKDKVFMGVDAVVFYRIKPDEISVKASQYNVASFADSNRHPCPNSTQGHHRRHGHGYSQHFQTHNQRQPQNSLR